MYFLVVHCLDEYIFQPAKSELSVAVLDYLNAKDIRLIERSVRHLYAQSRKIHAILISSYSCRRSGQSTTEDLLHYHVTTTGAGSFNGIEEVDNQQPTSYIL